MDRRVFDVRAILCALSQVEALKPLASKFNVPGDPIATALNIAEWIVTNLEYVSDKELGYENYVLMPLETLERGGGDCEDLSLLLATLILATNLWDNVTLLYVDYVNTEIGHVDVAVWINGSPYALPLIENPYPMALNTDYCGYWRDEGLEIANITLYTVYKTADGFTVNVAELERFKCEAIYPPPITNEHIVEVEREVSRWLSSILNVNTEDYPGYMENLTEYMMSYLPREEPPIHYGYYPLPLIIDWYSYKDPKWVAQRVIDRIEDEIPSIASWLNENYEGCVVVRAELDTLRVNVTKHTLEGGMYTVEEERPVIVVYLFLPADYPVPQVEVGVKDGKLVVNVYSVGDVQILFYKLYDRVPVLGVTKPGWYYEDIPYVEADLWQVIEESKLTHVEVSTTKINSVLDGGTYELIVWVDDKIAYVMVYEAG